MKKLRTGILKQLFLFISFFLTANLIAQTKGYINPTATSSAKIRNVDMGNVKWTNGFWKERFDLCMTNAVPAQWEYFMNFSENNFRILANKSNQTEGYKGTYWQDGDYYKYLEAQISDYSVTKDPKLLAKIEEKAQMIARAQATDGYITTHTQIGFGLKDQGPFRWSEYKGDKRFLSASLHETYNMGHLLTLATTHYRVTGSKTLLNVAIKAGDFLDLYFKEFTPELAKIDYNPTQLMGLVELYRVTGDKKYLNLADRFMTARGKGKITQSQNDTPLRKETQAMGHAVTATVLYSGAADICAETGDAKLLSALKDIWTDIYNRKASVTGGLGNVHNGISPNNKKEVVHEAFGMPYKLDNAITYNETCATYYGAYFSWRMFLLTGESKYIDKMENAFYNNLSAMSLDAKSYFYTNPLRWYGKDHQLLSLDYHERWTTECTCVCCPTSVARFLTQSKEYAYAVDDQSLYVTLYGSNEIVTKIGNTNLRFTQTTNYPWEGNVSLLYDGDKNASFNLKLRIPAWAENVTLKINGAEQVVNSGTFATINRQWKKGDKVELNLNLKAQLIEGNPKVEEIRNQVAVSYGPLVYCVEQRDLPNGIKIDDIVLPMNSKFIIEYKKDFLGGINSISTVDAYARTKSFDNKELYLPLKTDLKPIKLQLIPYYAWSNRGEDEMSVFIPLKW